MDQDQTMQRKDDGITQLVRQLTSVDRRLQHLATGQGDAVAGRHSASSTLLQHVQAQFHREEAQIRLLLDHLPAIVWTTDDEMRITSIAGSGLSAVGLYPEQIVGKCVSDCSQTEDDISPAVKAHRQALEGGPAACEFEIADRAYDCSIDPVQDRDGRITGTVGLAVEIRAWAEVEGDLRVQRTKMEKRLEEPAAQLVEAREELQVTEEEIRPQNEQLRAARRQLEAERRRYRELLESAPEGYVVTDTRGVILEANRAAARMLGVPADFLTGEPVGLYIAEGDRGAFHALMRRAKGDAGNRRIEGRLEVVPRDGEVLAAFVSVASRHSPHGTCALHWLLYDVTESRRFPEEYRRQGQFLEQLMDVAPIGIAVVSGDDHRFEMASAYYRAMPGIEHPIVGRTFNEVFPNAPPGQGADLLDAVYQSGRAAHVHEVEGGREQDCGQTYWNVDVVPLNGLDETTDRLLIISRDVSQGVQARKAAEQLAVQIETQANQVSAVVQAMTDAVIVYDDRGTPVLANYAAKKAYGLDPTGMHRAELVQTLEVRSLEGQPVDMNELPASRALRGDRVKGARLLLRNAEGETAMILASAAPLRTADAVRGCVVVWHDVTERDELLSEVSRQRQLAEELAQALQQERDKLQTIMENTHAQLAYLDADFNFVHVNTAYASDAGHSKDELVGQNHFDLFPDPENEVIFKRVLETREPVSFRGKPFVYSDQPERGITYWDWSLVPIEDNQGDVQGLVFSLLNVTEREQSMRQLGGERARLRAIIENIPEGIVVVDANARITMTNHAADGMFDQHVPYGEPYTAHDDLRLFYPDGTSYEPRHLPLTRAALDGETHEGLELALIKPSGERRDLLVSTAPIGAGIGDRSGAVGIFRDITGRKRTEQAMQHYARRLQILHDLDKAILMTHSAEKIADEALQRLKELIQCQRASVELFDFEAAEAVVLAVDSEGETALEANQRTPLKRNLALDDLRVGRTFVAEDLDGVAPSPLIETLRQEGSRSFMSVPLRTRDELLGAVNVALASTGGPKSEHVAAIQEVAQELAIGIHHARLHQELQDYATELEHRVANRTAQLRDSEARFRAIFEQSALGIGLLDRSGRVMLSNPALQEILGRNQEEMSGIRLTAFVHPEEDITLDVAAYRQMSIGERDHYRLETRYLGREEDTRWANLVLSLVRDAEGQPQFIIAIIEDITERKKAREALIQSERLATTGRLAASLAHEINNPLQTVIGCLGLAEESMEGEDNQEEVETYVTMAHDELKRAARIVSRLRDLSRPTDPGHGEPTDVNDLIDGVLKVSRKDLKNHQIQVVRQLAHDLPHPIVVQDRIKQVLLNLVLNARDAMPRGGQLTLRSEYDKTRDEVIVTVVDRGTGIPEDVLDRMFDPFFSTKSEGTGLGLFVSRNILQEQGGRIEVESTVGEGSAFKVYLPSSPP